MGVLALVLALLDLTGAVQLWHVYALAFGLGVASAIDTPVRQAFVVEMVGPDDLPNAVSLNSATFNSARIIGPALAGVAIAASAPGWVFAANALSYVAVLAGLHAIRTSELFPSKRWSARRASCARAWRTSASGRTCSCRWCWSSWSAPSG
jgi:MFS family permease